MSDIETNVKPCAGTCGRMTRSTRYTAEQLPNTVTRITADLCAACKRDADKAAKTPEELAAEEAERLQRKEEGYEAARKAAAAFSAQRAARQRARQARDARLNGAVGGRMVRV